MGNKWKVTLLMVEGLELDDLYGLFQPKPLCNSVILCLQAGKIVGNICDF